MAELKKIVHIEDDDDIREIARLALEVVGGFEVEQFPDGQDAVAHAAETNADLFVIDVMMPGLSGPETLAELRRIPACANVPAIFVTAKAQTREIEELKELDVAGVITKPFDPVTLSDQIRSIWAEVV